MATVVTCNVNGMEKNRGVPGRESFAYVNGTVLAPITVCMTGEAAFVQAVSNRVVSASAGPQCEQLPYF